MIANEFQYNLTRAQAAKFEQALERLIASPEGEAKQAALIPPILRAAERAALQSQLESLQAEIADYEALRAGQRRAFVGESFEELPQLLIQARVASGLTQKELAERLGLKEQQIQRYEATRYESASLKRVGEVVAALGLQIREEAILR